jgi:hypothetical protein
MNPSISQAGVDRTGAKAERALTPVRDRDAICRRTGTRASIALAETR